MKLRLFDDLIRLRLSRDEVARIAQGEAIEATLATQPISFRYRLGLADQAPNVSVTFDGMLLAIMLPTQYARQWATGDTESIEAIDGEIRVLIQRDFACPPDADADQAEPRSNPRRV